MFNQHMMDAAKMLSNAIGNRWGGWYVVSVGREPDGGRALHVSFDRDHNPALTLHGEYSGYPVRLLPMARPEDVTAMA